MPDVTQEPHFHRTSLRLRGKVIMTADPKEPFVHVFVSDAVREPTLAMHPECAEKLMWGKKVVGLRIDLTRAQSALVQELLRQAWEEKAPPSLRRHSTAKGR
jgi:hypothetical protein